VSDANSFEQWPVIVTGGGGALGLAVCEALLEGGAEVHVPAHGDSDAARLAPWAERGVRVTAGVDLTDETSVGDFYDGVGAAPWASIHLAGGFVWGPLVGAELADLDRMIAMNLRTTWLCCREAARRMGDDGGRIVNVAAKPALVPTADLVTYAATKAAVAALTQGLAEELAGRRIWVNAVVPSVMDTAANRESMPDADPEAWPKVEEVARTIVFLASPANAVTRGALVPVYGRS
tara:strand:- start:4386 stop:5090 length:705 start_codon:yes stop_codon:yes gene_type:complete